MKKNHLLFCLFVGVVYSCFSQKTSGTIIYHQEIIELEDSSKNVENSVYKEMYKAELRSIQESSKSISYTLKFNSSEASFMLNKSLDSDGTEGSYIDAAYHVDGDGRRYFSSKNNVAFWGHNAFDVDVVLIDSISTKDWIITKDIKKIGDYVVNKATRKKMLDNGKTVVVTAWFAPSIPNNYGPLGYYGLPGLILELHERDFVIFAKQIKLHSKNLKIQKNLKGDYLTRSEYEKFTNNAVENSIFNPNNLP